ncbi:prepilin-type N-terminal cleavage/methylation domain-containing protein [Eggerthella sinensis]|uniref:prepilin-type N-terminal cleavage/methylation domain-containing protein n=1 Tax=Eggerthella sinensis TaxID=242230 RepID=UPI00266C6DE5|nr:prepilin-type N-terminal cleavage/methylation domain-containing protein [Eggerthella sinensis]
MIKRVREDRGGFTLAELLVVVAIVAVLVAIAVPVFTSSMDSANNATKDANIRSVRAAGVTEILAGTTTDLNKTGPWNATASVDAKGNITNLTVGNGAAASEGYTTGSVTDGGTVAATITEISTSSSSSSSSS